MPSDDKILALTTAQVLRPRGRPKGAMNKDTAEKIKIAKKLDKIIGSKASDLIRAAMIPAFGATFIFRIDEIENERGKKIKKHVKLDNAHEIAKALDAIANNQGMTDDEQYVYISKEKPDIRAIEMLVIRLLGKPVETLEVNQNHKFDLIELARMRDEQRLIDAQNETPLHVDSQPIDVSSTEIENA